MLTIDTPRFTITLKIQVFLIMKLKLYLVKREGEIADNTCNPPQSPKEWHPLCQ